MGISSRSRGVCDTGVGDVAHDLCWMDMLKGLAIVGVVLDNWTGYMKQAPTPVFFYRLVQVIGAGVGPLVQVFFILSGFGLTISYYRRHQEWSWRRFAWRRFTKIVIPYEIAVLFAFAAGAIGNQIYPTVNASFCYSELLSNLTFLRNFHPPAWMWNPSFWFMPALIGLYLCFPFMLQILTRRGPWILIGLSLIIGYGTLGLAYVTGFYRGHGSDLFAYWMFQFGLGMALACWREKQPARLRVLVGLWPALIGVLLIALSGGVRTWPGGKVFNDALTSTGVFLLLLNVVWSGQRRLPFSGKIMMALGLRSYLIYLFHYPLMSFLIGPPLPSPMHPLLVLALGCVFVALMYLLTGSVAQPLSRMTGWLYGLYRPVVRTQPGLTDGG